MKQTQTIPETFLSVGYTRDRAGLPLEAVRVPVPQPAADHVLIRVAGSSLNPLEYKLARMVTDPELSAEILREAEKSLMAARS
jgi:NADPH:quinone reductase-like Zn-dependent oxidoreductase